MPRNIYRVQGDEQPGKALHVTIPREIALRHGIHKHTEVEIWDCQEIDKEGRVVNVMKVVKVGQTGEAAMPKAELMEPRLTGLPEPHLLYQHRDFFRKEEQGKQGGEE